MRELDLETKASEGAFEDCAREDFLRGARRYSVTKFCPNRLDWKPTQKPTFIAWVVRSPKAYQYVSSLPSMRANVFWGREAKQNEDFVAEFRQLADTWRRETAVLSSLHRIVLNPAYQRIIGLGPAAIPLILDELRNRPGHWFWALHAITDENPVTSGATFKEAVNAWLNWGRAKGYV